MGTKILIVEDQFIEANDLRIILENAGHIVTGIANSYEQACTMLKKQRPDIALLDILLKGALNGIDLAHRLVKLNIPFIYLSANSNPSVLEQAKLTRPSGFLVKPFRALDVLTVLDIANYRHIHQTELLSKQESFISGMLSGLLRSQSNTETKLMRIARAFKPFIPFDFLFIDVDHMNPDLNNVFSLQRVGFDQFVTTTGAKLAIEYSLNSAQWSDWRKEKLFLDNVLLENEDEVKKARIHDDFLRDMTAKTGLKSRIFVPLPTSSGRQMSMRMYCREEQVYTAEHLELLTLLKATLATVIENISWSEVLENRTAAIPALEIPPPCATMSEGIIGSSPKLLRAMDLGTQVAASDMTVLVLGETGVGKEGFVQSIHRTSGRSKNRLVKINCAAIPSTLIESELFGHEKGAFTGAYDRRIGKFEQANGGTIFLDEIGDIPLEVQTKLLRVLQEKEFERIGGRTTIKVDVRVIAATNRDLYKDVVNGTFRMDLFYRLNVFPIVLPPLRERKDDIPLLVSHFLKSYANETQGTVKEFAGGVLERLNKYSWPGNIRELRHVVERSIILSPSNIILYVDIPEESLIQEEAISADPANFLTIEEVDRAHIISALKKCNGKVSGKGGAAEILNLPATTLNSKMKRLGISWKFIY